MKLVKFLGFGRWTDDFKIHPSDCSVHVQSVMGVTSPNPVPNITTWAQRPPTMSIIRSGKIKQQNINGYQLL